MGLGGVISNLLSLGSKLLPVVNDSAQTPSSSSPPAEGQQIEAELKHLMKLLERIKATLYDAEGREIIDSSVKLWLEDLSEVAYDAEDVLDEYHYEVLRAQVEARHDSQPDSRKRKQITLPDGMYDQIKQIKEKFDEIEKYRIAFRLSDEDGPRRCNSEMQLAPTSHFVVESDIIGREEEKEKLVGILCSECHDGKVIKVVTIVGTGGLGKTTLAQVAYNYLRREQGFDKFGWVCVSEDFNVQRVTREVIESITESSCGLTNLSALQNKISEDIRGKRVLLVLDDVWNENISHWELFRISFMSAKHVVILVTTRNEYVAKIMQTVPSFNLGYMSQEHCWRLFHHYAFGEINQSEDSKFVEIGKQILNKCGKLPLAIKHVASLLRHEAQEEGWSEILESELWKSDAGNKIFPPLLISYARLPTSLKPCFLYCSMFPKDYTFNVDELVQLWTSMGYIVSNGKKSTKKVGQQYAEQLRQRSFFENDCDEGIKLHDMIHDLARSKSENSCYSFDMGNDPDGSSQKPNHLYAAGVVKHFNPLRSFNFDALRTLIFNLTVDEEQDVYVDISKAHKLRALKLDRESDSFFVLVSSNNKLKHLRYLSLTNCLLPEYLSSMCLLRILTLRGCDFEELPEGIGNLVSIEEFIIEGCLSLKKLPIELGNLKNIQTLGIADTRVSSLPSSLNKIKGTLFVRLECETIGWLKDFVDLKGTLILYELRNIVSLADAQRANLVSLHALECLWLYWDDIYILPDLYGESSNFQLNLSGQCNPHHDDQDHYSSMVLLQPHHNLRELHINDYPCVTFPEWFGNPSTCAALEKIIIADCQKLASLSFGSLYKLKYLKIFNCGGLQLLEVDSLTQLQKLKISLCDALVSVPRIQKLKSLVKLHMSYCMNLQRIVTDVEDSVQLMCTDKSSYQSSLCGLNDLTTSLRSLHIRRCAKLQALIEEPPPIQSCEVTIYECPGMKDWCLYHNIFYEDTWS